MCNNKSDQIGYEITETLNLGEILGNSNVVLSLYITSQCFRCYTMSEVGHLAAFLSHLAQNVSQLLTSGCLLLYYTCFHVGTLQLRICFISIT